MASTRKKLVLYADHPNGSIRNANVVGGFIRGGRHLHVISPGYDAQGRRRTTWTQVVDGDVPIWEHRVAAPTDAVIKLFAQTFDDTVGSDLALWDKAVERAKAARRDRFRDGVSGVEAAPALTQDGRTSGLSYSA